DGAVAPEIGHAAGQERQRLLELRPGQGRTHAEVDAGAEGHLDGVAFGGDVESVRRGEDLGVHVGAGQGDRDDRSGGEQDVAVLDVHRRHPHRAPPREQVAPGGGGGARGGGGGGRACWGGGGERGPAGRACWGGGGWVPAM